MERKALHTSRLEEAKIPNIFQQNSSIIGFCNLDPNATRKFVSFSENVAINSKVTMH